MLVKAIIILFLLIILYSLGSALFYLVRDKGKDNNRVAMALTWRIGLSMLLFILLFIAFSLGWIAPHGIIGG
ncbi:MAG: twin transmembrane helix small protein [Pseudomonadota bacterium]